MTGPSATVRTSTPLSPFSPPAEAEQDERRDPDHEEPVEGKVTDPDGDRAPEGFGGGEGAPLDAEGDADEVHQHVSEAEGEEERVVDPAAIEGADQDPLHDEAKRADDHRDAEEAEPEVPRQPEEVDAEVRAHRDKECR